jgi:hypothetical protein
MPKDDFEMSRERREEQAGVICGQKDRPQIILFLVRRQEEREQVQGLPAAGKHLATVPSGVRQLESLDFLNPWLAHLGGSAQKTGDWLHLFSA